MLKKNFIGKVVFTIGLLSIQPHFVVSAPPLYNPFGFITQGIAQGMARVGAVSAAVCAAYALSKRIPVQRPSDQIARK